MEDYKAKPAKSFVRFFFLLAYSVSKFSCNCHSNTLYFGFSRLICNLVEVQVLKIEVSARRTLIE